MWLRRVFLGAQFLSMEWRPPKFVAVNWEKRYGRLGMDRGVILLRTCVLLKLSVRWTLQRRPLTNPS